MGVARIYFDHNATTPPAPAVVDAMAGILRDTFGNPSSVHYFGQRAKAALDAARSAVAALIGGRPDEIVFTSGGTEADNFALRGAADALAPTGRRHLAASAIEHEAVLNTLKALERRGWTTTLLPVTSEGLVEPDALEAAVTEETALVSVMQANNEIGTVQPIAELAAKAAAQGALFHTDAVQSVGKLPIDVRALGVDLLSLSGHKFHGPKGVGALWIRRGTRLSATLTGGRQEKNRRAGTENLPAIVGLGVAAQLALEGADPLSGEPARIGALRDRLETGVRRGVPAIAVSGEGAPRVPNTSNISFEGIEAESLLIALDLEGVAVSTGSACSSGTLEPSHVLQAMGFGATRARNSLRFSLGHDNTEAEVDRVVELLPRLVERLRAVTDQRAQHEAVLGS
ncbi:MAG: aminotransferase class V-fold PLP-dependent enzyme [Luteitalea sp.]|nr:aminotransferase class V-fold PLP-dependent enzyme [Luteitalea sp.]